jgi:hypothetical protein
MIEQSDLGFGQRESRRGSGARTVEHRHPEDAPAQDAIDRNQVCQALSGPEFGFFGPTARFEDLVEHLYFPSQGIPFEFLDGVIARLNGQIGDQLPIDLLLFFGCPRSSAWVAVKLSAGSLLFADRRQDLNPAIPDLENGFVGIAVVIFDFDAMQAFDRDLVPWLLDPGTTRSFARDRTLACRRLLEQLAPPHTTLEATAHA